MRFQFPEVAQCTRVSQFTYTRAYAPSAREHCTGTISFPRTVLSLILFVSACSAFPYKCAFVFYSHFINRQKLLFFSYFLIFCEYSFLPAHFFFFLVIKKTFALRPARLKFLSNLSSYPIISYQTMVT